MSLSNPSEPPSSHIDGLALRPTSEAPALSIPARFGTWLALRLVILAFGLPLSTLLFLGGPAILAGFGALLLEQGGVRFEPWSELARWQDPERWAVVAGMAIMIFVTRSTPRESSEEPSVIAGLWRVLGGILIAVWLLAIVIEFVPRSTLNPTLHYFLLASLVTWTAWTLAWLTGSAMGHLHAAGRSAAFRSATSRGAILAAGPSLALGLVGVSAVFVGSELDEHAIESVEREIGRTFTGTRGLAPTSEGTPATSRPRLLAPDDCFETIFEGVGERRLWKRGVDLARGNGAWDPEEVASSAAMKVCAKPREYENFAAYYLRAVRSEISKSFGRERRLERCEIGWQDRQAPLLDDDCIAELICRLGEPEQTLARLHIEGYTDAELARKLDLGPAAATKRRQRVFSRLSASAQLECR